MSRKPIAHLVTFKRTGTTKLYKTLRGATNAMDRADWEYGAICTYRRPIWEDS